MYEAGTTFIEWWNTSVEELSLVIRKNPSLRGMVLGYLAEEKLRQFFANLPGITATRKDDDHDRKKKGDLVVTFEGEEFIVESKALQTNSIKKVGAGRFVGKVQCDASDRRKIKLDNGSAVETTCLRVGEFDILAACLFSFRETWDFAFALNRDLPRTEHKKYPPKVRSQLIKSLVPVSWPIQSPFVLDPMVLLRRLLRDR